MTTYGIQNKTSGDGLIYEVRHNGRLLAVYDDIDEARSHIESANANDAYLIEEAARTEAAQARGVGDRAIPVGFTTKSLTDGSEVYDVAIAGAVFHCVTERDAIDFLAGFRELVGKHTLDCLHVTYRTEG
jgi:hypothetical protein